MSAKIFLRIYSAMLRVPPVFRLSMVVLMMLGLLGGAVAPAAAESGVPSGQADGPLIPGYTLQDGKRIPAPTGYIQMSVITGENQPCGPFIIPQDLFLDRKTGNLLVADTGNNRVVVLDANGSYLYQIGGEQAGLKEPMGLFVDDDGNIWVADKGNKRVAVFTPAGELIDEHFKPESEFLVTMDFAPSKITVDKRGFIYVVTGSEASLGVVVIDANERFRGFFGRTPLKFDLGRLIARALATKEQRRRMLRIQPAPLNNLFLDSQGFIYAVSPILDKDQIQRLNSVGSNVYGEVGLRTGAGRLWDKLLGKEGMVFGETSTLWTWNDAMRMSVPVTVHPSFVDIAVDDLGIVSVLEYRYNRIYQYDQAGNLLTIFGGKGLSAGMFSQPNSIVAGSQGLLYILDAVRGDIQVFRPTDLTRQIHEASHEYFNGDYGNAAKLWGEIAQRNTNFSLAHSGLGKALMSQKRYREAMQEYFYAENKAGYSAAFYEYRYLWMRDNFILVGLVVVGALAVAGLAGNPILNQLNRLLAWIKNLHVRAGLWAVPVLVLLTIFVRLISLSSLNFHFWEMRPDQIRLLFEGGKILLPWVTWCIAAFWVGEIFYGEATFRKIVIASAWALWPMIVFPIPVNLLTHVLTLNEQAMFDLLWFAISAWTAWNFFQVVRDEHAFDFGKAVLVTALSLVGIVAIWILSGLVYALTAEIFRFIASVALEIYVRLY